MSPVRIVFSGVPTAPLVAMIEHLDDVIRELALVQTGAMTGVAAATVPLELLHTMEWVRPVLFAAKVQVSAQAGAAWRAGADRLDVTVDLPEDAGAALAEVLAALENIDAQPPGASGLLMPAARPDIARFRHEFFTVLSDRLAEAGAAPPGP